MKNYLHTLLVSGMTLGLILFGATQIFAQSPHNRVTICHATNSHSNPYVSLTVDQDSVDGDLGNDNGQGDHYLEHTGPVWYEGIEDHSWGDIIPPIEGVHDGLNWTEEGQAIWENGCNAVVEASPSPSPTPSPSETPSPTVSPSPASSPASEPEPTPGTGGPTPQDGAALHTSDRTCDNPNFDVKMDVFDHGNPVEGLLVRFRFNGEDKEAHTNANGRAQVSFKLADGTITAEVPGYGTYTHTISKPENCPNVHLDPNKVESNGDVLGASTQVAMASNTNVRGRGQVLGASTLADTGNFTTYLALIAAGAGAMLSTAAGYAIYQEN